MSSVQRRQQPVDCSKENGGTRGGGKMSSRMDTPTVTGAARIVPSRYKQTPQSLLRSSSTSNPGYGASVSAAAKLLQEATSTTVNPCAVSCGDGAIVPKKLSKVSTGNDTDACAAAATGSSSCPNSPLCSTQRKQQQIKTSKDNGSTKVHQQQLSDVLQSRSSKIPSRIDTPTVTGAARVVPSRYRQTPQSIHRSSPTNNPAGTLVSAANRLLQEATGTPANPCAVSQDDGVVVSRKLSKVSTGHDVDSCATATQGSSCPSSPVCTQSNKTRTLSAMRSSMPEVDRSLTERNRDNNSRTIDDCSSYKSATSTCARSLHLPAAGNENSSSWLSLKPNDSFVSLPSRSSSFKTGSLCLPPHPASTKLGPDARKGRKGSSDPEHSLKLLYNHYLQWRFANAKAEASMRSQKQDSEKRLYSFSLQLSDLRLVVSQKRAELEALRRNQTLSNILEAQVPCLEEWAILEEDYSTSLSGITSALHNCSLRLPIGAGVQVDTKELGEALNSATKVMEMIGSHIQNFTQKAEETDILISELARVSSGEKALVEECGDLLLKSYTSHVAECSLRAQMIQMHRENNLKQVQTE